MPQSPTVDGSRLWRRLMALAEITDPAVPYTRRSFTPLYLEGRDHVRRLFAEAGLEVELDAAANLIGRRPAGGNRPPIVLGSHTDTVPAGGRFDGILGVLCALEVAETLADAGIALDHPLEIVDFLAEEPSEFGLSCIGSRAIAGAITEEMLDATRPDGMTLREGIRFVGGDPEALAAVRRGPDAIHAYLEVHIEQARALESASIPIGTVTGIAAIRRERISIEGRTDHAGATPMALRRDALVAAAELISAVSQTAGAVSTDTSPLVATVGWVEVRPNAANAVPGEVRLILEARAQDDAQLDAFLTEGLAGTVAAIEARAFTLTREPFSRTTPTACDPRIIAAIDESAAARGLATRHLPSGAGHDGVFMARTGPMGMIFTPCRDGLSHAPGEWAEQDDCTTAAQIMLDTVLRLDRL